MTQKKRSKLIVIIVGSVFVAGMLGMSGLSFVKFGTFNYAETTMALCLIFSGDEYVEINSAPNKIVIATPYNSAQVFEDYMTEMGYTILEDEQLGSLMVVLQDGKRETVAVSANKYYSVWRWVE